MPTAVKLKQKNRPTGESDWNSLLIFEWAVLFLVLVLLVFQLVAIKALRAGLEKDLANSNFSAEPLILESLNYHGFQEPPNFPSALLRGKVGNFVSSQEYKLSGQAVLKYVSFISDVAPEELLAFYKSYLSGKAYQLSASAGAVDGILGFRAERANLMMDFDLSQQDRGSLVSIYYRGAF